MAFATDWRKRVNALVEESRDEQCPSRDGRFARAIELVAAAASGDLAAVRHPLDADPSLLASTDRYGDAPLARAARGAHLEVVAEPLARGADPHASRSGTDAG
jgi:ankyrin repeat protein